MRRSLVVALFATLLLVVSMAPVGATPPLDVDFWEETNIDGQPDLPFGASGPAVDAGIICDEGTQWDESAKFAGFSGKFTGVNVQVFKRFDCADGSGSFLMKMQVREDRKGNNFTWIIVSGTGDYVDLRGAGSGFGSYEGPFDVCVGRCVFNALEGGLH